MHCRLIRLCEVLERTSLSRSALYRLLSTNSFPAPVKPTLGRINAWSSDEVGNWIAARLTEREQQE
jgi:predicted DNA-binding transcriptional regulator AlpA